MPTPPKRKRNERKTLTNRIDRNYSTYVRRSDANPTTGLAKCYTCDHTAHWSRLDAGHFQSRAKLATRWHLDRGHPWSGTQPINCRAQCKRCNMRGGEQYRFAKAIDQEFGPGTAQALEEEAAQSCRRTIQELRDLDATLRDLVKDQDRRHR